MERRTGTTELEKGKRAVCLLSGGLDSTVAAAVANNEGYELYFMFANYGQKTFEREKEAVAKVTELLKPKKVLNLDLTWLKDMGISALFEPETTLNEENLTAEYVPFRNSLLISAATAWAESIGADAIFIGSSGGDHICPDNSPEYINAMQNVIEQGTMIKKDIKLIAPLVKHEKDFTVSLGYKLGLPFEITWSCHNNFELPCGHCSNCSSRIEAFKQLGQKDPLEYLE